MSETKNKKQMTTLEAIKFAREVKAAGAGDPTEKALVALLDHGDSLEVPDLETAIRIVAANMHSMGRFYIEIAVDPSTKEIGWTFEPTMPDATDNN